MSLGDGLGFLGVILALLGTAVTFLWPTRRWIGWTCIGLAGVLVVWWGLLEVRGRNTANLEYPAEIARAQPSRHLTSASAFSVAIEFKVLSFERQITFFWVQHGQDIYASNLALFLSVTNLQDVPSTISRYSIEEYSDKSHACKLKMLETVTGRVFIVPLKGSASPLAIGREIQVPADNTATSLVNVSPEAVDFQNAALLELKPLDRLLGSKPLEPNQPVRGWSFFQCDCFFPSVVIVRLTDILGNEFSYRIEHSNRTRTGDLLPRKFILAASADLSTNVKHVFLEP